MRDCTQCGNELEPFFDSTCEPPVAWLCQACGNVRLEVELRTLSAAARRELETLQAFMTPGPSTPEPARATTAPEVGRARARARMILDEIREIPVDVERIAQQHGFPVRERPLPRGERGTIARDGAHTVIVLNRERPIRAEGERRWVIAEELGHALLEHSTLVASAAVGAVPAIPEPRRRAEEREAKVFAAELLMPEEKIRGRFTELAPRIAQALGLRQRQSQTDEVVAALARMFAVSPAAVRLRLEELNLLT